MTPLAAAIAASGLPREEVCRRGRVSPRYLQQLARTGAPYYTALRLARVLGCDLNAFIRPANGCPRRVRQGKRGAARRSGRLPAGTWEGRR